jgi:hypothetical protein
MDLFNNIPLMRFMMTSEAAALCRGEVKLLQVLLPENTKFKDLFESWSLGSPGQHIHHFYQEQQSKLDDALRNGKIRNINQFEKYLGLSSYGIDLNSNLARYDALFDFKDSRHILKQYVKHDWFSKNVAEKWNQFLSTENNTGRYLNLEIQQVTEIINQGIKEEWRRKNYYTALGGLENQLSVLHRPNIAFEAKQVAILPAFYDELELMREEDSGKPTPVLVVRDLNTFAEIARPHAGSEVIQRAETIDCGLLSPFHNITLNEIASWHNQTDERSVEFQTSLLKIEAVLNSPPGTYSRDKIKSVVNRHIHAINSCIDQLGKRRASQIKGAGTFVQLYVPDKTTLVEVGTISILNLMASLSPLAFHVPDRLTTAIRVVCTTVTSAAATLLFKSPAPSHKWHKAQGAFKKIMNSGIEDLQNRLANNR